MIMTPRVAFDTAFRSPLTKSKSRNSTHFCTISGGRASKEEAMVNKIDDFCRSLTVKPGEPNAELAD